MKRIFLQPTIALALGAILFASFEKPIVDDNYHSAVRGKLPSIVTSHSNKPIHLPRAAVEVHQYRVVYKGGQVAVQFIY